MQKALITVAAMAITYVISTKFVLKSENKNTSADFKRFFEKQADKIRSYQKSK